MKDKHLSLEEIKNLQIEMLKYFDQFCRANGITYYLSYGTLLGAARHKGYIPWDDDVDVMVPRYEIERLKQIFPKEGRYRIASVDTDKNYNLSYPRVIDTQTYAKIGVFGRTYGVNIDIYPIDAYPLKENDYPEYIQNIKELSAKVELIKKWTKRAVRYFPLPMFSLIRNMEKSLAMAYGANDFETATKVHVCDLNPEPINKSLFEEKVEVEFEGQLYYAPIGWESILRIWYGDWTQLPPEEKRHPYHGTTNLYLKVKSHER